MIPNSLLKDPTVRIRGLIRVVNPALGDRVAEVLDDAVFVSNFEDVDQDEFDVLVTDVPWGADRANLKELASPNLFVFYCHMTGVSRLDMVQVGSGPNDWLWIENTNTGKPIPPSAIRTDLGVDLTQLVRETLIPVNLTERFQASAVIGSVAVDLAEARKTLLDPILAGNGGHVLAGRYKRLNGTECWLLPQQCANAAWFRAALKRWSPAIEQRTARPWREDVHWLTMPERRLRDELFTLTSERNALDQRESELNEKLEKAMEQGDATERRLLLNQGDSLKTAVADALRTMEFEVIDVDSESATKGDLLEDLHVRDGDWLALAEVRGYSGSQGAKVSDLLRIGRFLRRWISDGNESPAATWYVVNQAIALDPDERSLPLASNPDEVAEFAADNGAVIDTRFLFKLLIQVQRDEMDPGTARSLLKETRGVFTLPEVSE